ncbi:MAG: cell division protein SepF [Coriobacteriia bacterium]|nr:cell division protein SepF [Coriobacteriia bacterium]
MGFFDDLKARFTDDTNYDDYDDFDEYEDDSPYAHRYNDEYQSRLSDNESVTVVSRRGFRSGQNTYEGSSYNAPRADRSFGGDSVLEAERSFSSLDRGPVPAARRSDDFEDSSFNPSTTKTNPRGFDASNYYIDNESSEPAPQGSHFPQEEIITLSPKSYNQAESIAKHMKAGKPVAISLAAAKVELAKRILDFTFGAAFALDADVERVGEKSFVILPKGVTLSESNRQKLRREKFISK